MVPIKHIHPHPSLPTRGEIIIATPHMITTRVIAPQYIECHINAKFNARNIVGVSNRNKILVTKLKEYNFLI
jgi:hypothetical protein